MRAAASEHRRRLLGRETLALVSVSALHRRSHAGEDVSADDWPIATAGKRHAVFQKCPQSVISARSFLAELFRGASLVERYLRRLHARHRAEPLESFGLAIDWRR